LGWGVTIGIVVLLVGGAFFYFEHRGTGKKQEAERRARDAARADTVPQTVNRPDGSTSSYSAIKPSKHKAQRPLGRL